MTGIQILKTEKKQTLKRLCVLYIIMLAVVIVIPVLTVPAADGLFGFVSYGSLNRMFAEVINIIVFVVAFRFLCKFYEKRGIIFAKTPDEVKKAELPLWRLGAIFALVTACIVAVSWQCGWEVKPFHDFGVKFTGYELLCNAAELIRGGFRCMMAVGMIAVGQRLGEELFGHPKFIWGGVLLALTLGIFELITNVGGLRITYFVFNFVFGYIYTLTDRSYGRTLLPVLLIYIF